MGQLTDWVCSNTLCTTKLKQLSGGPDRGFVAFTNTLRCTECAHIDDYAVNKAGDMGHGKQHQHDTEPACSECNGKTIPWNRQCPSCDAKMQEGGLNGELCLKTMWD
jgi:hypothetical protein